MLEKITIRQQKFKVAYAIKKLWNLNDLILRIK